MEDRTLNQTVLNLYDNFKEFGKKHSIRELAEHIYPEWTIVSITNNSLTIVATIETCESYFDFRVQVIKNAYDTNVVITYDRILD